MVRQYRTFSNLIFTVVTRCVGYLYTVSEWFNPLEPPRTFSNHFSAEKERCVEVFDVSSEWFDNTEPSRTSSSQWSLDHGVRGSRAALCVFNTLSRPLFGDRLCPRCEVSIAEDSTYLEHLLNLGSAEELKS